MDCKEKVCAVMLLYIGFVSGVPLDGLCDFDDNCGTMDSFCNNGTCSCIENFTRFEDSCVRVITPKVPCTNNGDCKFRLRSMCVRKTCTCRPFHHEENGQCIKSRVLEETCDKDFQCYWGQKMQNKVGCVEGKCDCMSGYKPSSNYKKCIALPVSQPISAGSCVTTPLVLLIYFVFSSILFRLLK